MEKFERVDTEAGTVVTYTEMWYKGGEVDMSWSKQMQLLQAGDGLSLDH